MDEHSSALSRSGWVLLWPLAAWAGLVLVGYPITVTLAGSAGLDEMFIALAMVLAIVYATMFVAMSRLERIAPEHRLTAAFKVAGIRFAATIVLMLLAVWWLPLDRTVFLLWVAGGYVVLIKVETFVLVKRIKQLEASRHD